MGNKSSLMLQDDEIKQISGQTGFSPQQIEKLYSRFTQLDRAHCGSLSKNDLLSIPELAINPLCDRLIEMFFFDRDQEDERINFRQFMRVLAAFRSNQQQQLAGTNNNNNHHNHRAEHSAAESDEAARSSSDENITRSPLGARRPPTRRPHKRSARIGLNDNGGHLSSPKLSKGSPSARSMITPTPTNSTRGQPDSLGDCLTEKLYFVFKIYDNDNDGRISFNDLRSILKMMVGNYIEEVQLDKIATRAFVEVDQDNDGFIEFGEFCKVFAGKDMEDKLRVKFR